MVQLVLETPSSFETALTGPPEDEGCGVENRMRAEPPKTWMAGSSPAMTGGCVVQGHLTVGGIEERIEAMLPPVLRPKIVPRS